jgi:hypothetical protein
VEGFLIRRKVMLEIALLPSLTLLFIYIIKSLLDKHLPNKTPREKELENNVTEFWDLLKRYNAGEEKKRNDNTE